MAASVIVLQGCATLAKRPSLKIYDIDYAIGYSFGRSFSASEQRYGHSALGWGGDHKFFAVPELKTFHDFFFSVSRKNFGVTLDFIQQKYDEIWHETLNRIEIYKNNRTENVFYGLGLGFEFRLFADRDKRFNPYISANAFALGYINLRPLLGEKNPDYPKREDFRLAGGLKIKTISPLFVDVRLSYFPKNSILSLSAGLDLIF